MTSSFKGAVARVAIAPVAAAALTFGLFSVAPAAQATESQTSAATAFAKANAAEKKKARKKRANSKVVLRLSRAKVALGSARTRTGARYVYGGTGPWGFDCSGLTRWAYRHVGKNLPRTSGAQAAATKRISRSQARPGDLVFFHRGGRVYHVGLYAGNNQLFHASRPGTPVGTAKIWTSSVFFGRVR